MRPVAAPLAQSRSKVSAMNGSVARIRLADSCGTSIRRCPAWAGSSAVASACMAEPTSPIGNSSTVPAPPYIITAVRLEEKSPGRLTASSMASHPITA